MSGSKRLQRARFPMCCGAQILYGFGYDNWDNVTKDPTKKEIKEFLQEWVDLTDFKIKPVEYGNMKMGAFHMAILNDHQKDALHHLFVEEGFEVVCSNYNSYLGNNIHLYVRKVKH
jgi:hypothetical protein